MSHVVRVSDDSEQNNSQREFIPEEQKQQTDSEKVKSGCHKYKGCFNSLMLLFMLGVFGAVGYTIYYFTKPSESSPSTSLNSKGSKSTFFVTTNSSVTSLSLLQTFVAVLPVEGADISISTTRISNRFNCSISYSSGSIAPFTQLLVLAENGDLVLGNSGIKYLTSTDGSISQQVCALGYKGTDCSLCIDYYVLQGSECVPTDQVTLAPTLAPTMAATLPPTSSTETPTLEPTTEPPTELPSPTETPAP
jgi:hypothetical protein